MKQLISRVILAVLVAQMIVPVTIAQDFGTQFLSDVGKIGGNSGMSFRKSEQFKLPGSSSNDPSGAESLRSKGMLMTEPAMAGLMYQVHILGEVKEPGTYRITASDRLSEVLKKAGGIDEQGSERNIEVRRQGEGIRKIDLLAFQQFGSLDDNPYLLDNDTVFVPLHGPIINIIGAVMRPKEYELKNEKTLANVLKLAGGNSIGASKDKSINVIRFVDNKKQVLEVKQTYDDMITFTIQNGDVIFVPHMITELNKFDFDLPKLPGDNIFYPSFEDRVFILGGVGAPGAYTFNPYYKLSQYLSLAGGTTKMFTGRIKLMTPDGKSRPIKNKQRDKIIINPGDTIVLGERRIPPEGWIGIVSGLTSLGLTALALSQTYGD